MSRLQLVKGARVDGVRTTPAPELRCDTEQRFRFPAEETWEVSCENQQKPVPVRAASSQLTSALS